MSLIIITILLTITRSQWIFASTRLPIARSDMAVGSYDRSIFLIGGLPVNREVITYDIDHNSFTTNIITEIPSDETLSSVGSQYFTSMNNILYIAQESYISIYNMATNSFTQQWKTYPSHTYSGAPCLASTSDTIYIIGGYYSTSSLSDDVYSLNLSSIQWNTNLPSLYMARASHSCIASTTNKIYVIGGSNSKSVEMISINNIETNTFKIIGYLSFEYEGLTGSRSVEFEGIIFIFGGWNQYIGYPKLVHIIDTSNDEISTSSHELRWGVRSPAAVIVDNIIYAFGGYKINSNYFDAWMYNELPTPDPTAAPSNKPSQSPSDHPSASPSYSPTTKEPTSDPSTSPSFAPSTKEPTYDPSAAPSSTQEPDTIHSHNETFYCNDIIVEIINLNGISAFDFKSKEELRLFIVNVTYYGITKNMDDYGIDKNSFYMEYESVSDNVNITQSICVRKENVLDVISLIVIDESSMIAGYIKNETIKYFNKLQLNDVSTDNMCISIYWESYEFGKEKSEGNDRNINIMEIPTLYVTVIILGLFLLFTFIALLDAKIIRKNDYLLPMNIITVSFEVLDTILDILFAVLLLFTFLIYQQIDILIATISSFVFIIVPITFSITQLIRQEKKSWTQSDYLRGWLLEHSWKLFVLSIITGSSYGAIEIVNCGAFGLEIFNMGLHKQQRLKFNTKRIFGVVVLENIPQTIFQIWYLVKFEVDLIPILSIVFAIISIALTVLTKYTQKSMIKNSATIKIQFDVKGKDITSKLSRQTDGIKKYMAKLFEVTIHLIDIPKPRVIDQGIRFQTFIFIKDPDSKDFESMINTAIKNERLVNIIQSEWNLDKSICIENVRCDNVNKNAECQMVYTQVNVNENELH